MKKLVLGFILSIVVLGVSAQGTFKVMFNKGANQYKTDAGEWLDIKTGLSLPDNATVKLGDSPYLGLSHSDGYNVELKDAGELALTDYHKEGGKDVINKYMDYIGNRVNESDEQGLAATGAVERATTSGFDVFLPKKASFFEASAKISWEELEGADSYFITVSDMMGTKVLEQEVTTTYTDIDLSKLEGPLFLLKVKGSNGTSSIEYALTPTPPAKRSTIETEITGLKSAVEPNSSMNALIFAEFYERNDCLVDAATYYQKAVELSPGVDYFQDMLVKFAERN